MNNERRVTGSLPKDFNLKIDQKIESLLQNIPENLTEKQIFRIILFNKLKIDNKIIELIPYVKNEQSLNSKRVLHDEIQQLHDLVNRILELVQSNLSVNNDLYLSFYISYAGFYEAILKDSSTAAEILKTIYHLSNKDLSNPILAIIKSKLSKPMVKSDIPKKTAEREIILKDIINPSPATSSSLIPNYREYIKNTIHINKPDSLLLEDEDQFSSILICLFDIFNSYKNLPFNAFSIIDTINVKYNNEIYNIFDLYLYSVSSIEVMYLNDLSLFLQDFHIVPHYLSLSDLKIVYELELETDKLCCFYGMTPSIKQNPNGLQFPKFVDIILRIAFIIFNVYPYTSKYKTMKSKFMGMVNDILELNKSNYECKIKSKRKILRVSNNYLSAFELQADTISVELINSLQSYFNTIRSLFNCYNTTDKKNLFLYKSNEGISATAFAKFCLDFHVSDSITKKSIINISFRYYKQILDLIYIYETCHKSSESKTDLLNFKGFLESLCRIGLIIKNNDTFYHSQKSKIEEFFNEIGLDSNRWRKNIKRNF